jgi:Tfp pilus assembly PilM family ATPase
MAVKTILGFDYGTHAIKVAWVESVRRGFHVARTETLRVPAGNGGSAAFVASWVEKNGLGKLPCVIGIPAQHVLFQPFAMQPDDPRTVEQAAGMEVARYSDMASEQMVHDAVAVKVSDHQKHVLLVMSRTSQVDQVLSNAGKFGLDVIDMVPSPVALYNAMEFRNQSRDAATLYINVGASCSEIAIGTGGGLLFARSFAIGGQMFTDAIARASNLTTAIAEERKVNATEAQPPGVLAPVMSLWIAELNACLAVYRNQFPERRLHPARIVLAGGGACLRGFPDAVSAALNIPASRADSQPRSAPAENPMLFSVAAGLAQSGIGHVTSPIRLLPPRVRDELSFRRQKPWWIAAALVSAAILGVSVAAGVYDSKQWQALLTNQNASLARRQELARQFYHARLQADAIQGMAIPVGALLKTGVVVRELISLIAANKAREDWITLISDSAFYNTPPTEAPPDGEAVAETRERRTARKQPLEAPGAKRVERVVVEGYTRTHDFTTVRDLIAAIQQAPYVEKADLLSDDRLVPPATERKLPGPEVKPFAIEITLRKP